MHACGRPSFPSPVNTVREGPSLRSRHALFDASAPAADPSPGSPGARKGGTRLPSEGTAAWGSEPPEPKATTELAGGGALGASCRNKSAPCRLQAATAAISSPPTLSSQVPRLTFSFTSFPELVAHGQSLFFPFFLMSPSRHTYPLLYLVICQQTNFWPDSFSHEELSTAVDAKNYIGNDISSCQGTPKAISVETQTPIV